MEILKEYLSESYEEIDVEESELVPRLEGVALFNPEQEEAIIAGSLRDYELPKIEAVHFAMNHRVDALYNALITAPLNESMEFKNQERYHSIARNLRTVVRYKANMLRSWFVRETIEVMQMSSSIYQRMDDWIVAAVLGENKQVAHATKNLQRLIAQS